MPIQILMPALSPTMTEGTVATWQKQEGDKVEPGDVIAEIETDKATMEVEAVDEGVLGRILVPAGSENVAVNTPIAILLAEGEDAAAAEPPPTPNAAPSVGVAEVSASPAPAAPTPAAQPRNNGERVLASPLAKRMAKQAGLDLAALTGTGPHGRIIKADIEAALAAGAGTVPSARPLAGAIEAPVAGDTTPAVGVPSDPHEVVPLNTMRRTIARRLAQAKRDIPHFYLTMAVELDSLLRLRGELNGRRDADYKLSVNDFVIKACAMALRRVPDANASFGGDVLYRFTNVDVAVAVAIDGGLITPIVRGADQKGLALISNEMKELAERARAGKLQPEEYQGGGFTISNLGMYGVREFSAVINPPQACILAVGAAEQRPVVKEGALAIATVMSATLSVDHRVVDGALGAELLQQVKSILQDPLQLLL
ncbi:MAG: pyruvate dehydrogenase complex dihydrolipoamide acetyltransferase [Pseudomonadota bacterium]